MSGKSKNTFNALLSESNPNQGDYGLRLIESFAEEFAKSMKKDSQKAMDFVKKNEAPVRDKIDNLDDLLSQLTQKWAAEGKGDEDEKGGKGGSTGDEVFITLCVLLGIDSSEQLLHDFIEDNQAHKYFNSQLLDTLPKEFNQVKSLLSSPSKRI